MRYTEEEKQFLTEYVPGHSRLEISQEFSRRFRDLSVEQVKSYITNHKLNTGRTGRFEKGMEPWNKGKHTGHSSPATEFKPGHMPHNHKTVGTEIIDVYGYIKVKVAEPKTWEFKHRLVWEEHHGKIPEGYIVVFRDGDKTNVDINNLALISRAANAKINRRRLSKSGDAFDTAVLIAKIDLEESKRKRGGKYGKGTNAV